MVEDATAHQRSGAVALVEQLRREGVEVIFGLPGDQLMVALDALFDAADIRYVVTRHEQGTTYMADGYARVAGRPGVAMVVPGVGVYNAANPLVVCGGGVSLANASQALTVVAEHLQSTVVTTREGKGGFDDRNPLSVGTMWVNPRLRPVLDGADVVLAVGTRLQGFGFGPATKILQVDVDTYEIGRNAPVEVALVGHARAVLQQLGDELRAPSDQPPSRAS